MYYTASQGKDGYKDSSNCPEGAYLLKPDRYHRWQDRYSTCSLRNVQGSELVQWEFICYKKTTTEPESAVVRVRYFGSLSPFIEIDVELNGIPVENDQHGKDVTVVWKFHNFDSNETFWTDSNGLEMQPRKLNYRPTWEYSGDQNISSNYYPVNSAIAMRDGDLQVTVLTDRSQAGSAALTTGQIELIHNRRLIFDDDRGVEEPLNETDRLGNGMQVNSKYYL